VKGCWVSSCTKGMREWGGVAGIGARRTMKACMYSSSGQGDRVNPARTEPFKIMVPGYGESQV
jgi:hypothetical protein